MFILNFPKGKAGRDEMMSALVNLLGSSNFDHGTIKMCVTLPKKK